MYAFLFNPPPWTPSLPITKTKTERKETEKGHLESAEITQVKRKRAKKQQARDNRRDKRHRGESVWQLHPPSTFTASVLLVLAEQDACKAVSVETYTSLHEEVPSAGPKPGVWCTHTLLRWFMWTLRRPETRFGKDKSAYCCFQMWNHTADGSHVLERPDDWTLPLVSTFNRSEFISGRVPVGAPGPNLVFHQQQDDFSECVYWSNLSHKKHAKGGGASPQYMCKPWGGWVHVWPEKSGGMWAGE